MTNERKWKPSKRRPPSGSRCDMHVGVDYSSHTPRIKRCPNEATVEILGYAPVGETWICETCMESIKTRTEQP